MEYKLYWIVFFVFFLFAINFVMKKFSFSLDKMSINESHKLLLRQDDSTPLSGTYYFLPIIFILFYKFDVIAIISCSFFFILGLMSDLKITNSPKLRLIFQFLILFFLLFLNNGIIIDTKIEALNNLMNHNLSRIMICSFFFMVLINGFNLIDGVNCLCSLNFLIVLFFSYLLIKNLSPSSFNYELIIMIIAISIFITFNFFGKNFLGDGAAYGIGFLLGFILIKISLLNNLVSPYFLANLLWYPAFENLFSIIRRALSKKKNYLPDNDHLHQMIFIYFKKKNFIKKNFLLSSFVGIVINLYLFFVYSIGYFFYTHTIIQITLITSSIIVYLILYYILVKFHK